MQVAGYRVSKMVNCNKPISKTRVLQKIQEIAKPGKILKFIKSLL